jgi:hypothetical protein
MHGDGQDPQRNGVTVADGSLRTPPPRVLRERDEFKSIINTELSVAANVR